MAALSPDFDGTGANMWLERVDSVQRAYRVRDAVIQLIAIGKFTGQAKNWYHSKLDYVQMNWESLKGEIRKMYSGSDDPHRTKNKTVTW